MLQPRPWQSGDPEFRGPGGAFTASFWTRLAERHLHPLRPPTDTHQNNITTSKPSIDWSGSIDHEWTKLRDPIGTAEHIGRSLACSHLCAALGLSGWHTCGKGRACPYRWLGETHGVRVWGFLCGLV